MFFISHPIIMGEGATIKTEANSVLENKSNMQVSNQITTTELVQ